MTGFVTPPLVLLPRRNVSDLVRFPLDKPEIAIWPNDDIPKDAIVAITRRERKLGKGA